MSTMLTEKLPDSERKAQLDSQNEGYVFDEQQLGIWKLFTERSSGITFQQEAKDALPLLVKLTAMIHATAPNLLLSYVVCSLWVPIYRVVEISLSSKLLRQIEAAVISRDVATGRFGSALLLKLLFVVFGSWINWWTSKITPVYESKIKTFLHLEMMKNNLYMDMLTSQTAGQQRLSADDTFRAMQQVMTFFVDLLSVISQAMLMFGLSREAGGVIFALLCICRPILGVATKDSFFRKAFFIHINNEDYKRMKSLEKFSDGSFRQDVIGYGLSNWILNQYLKAFRNLGNTSVADPWEHMGTRESPMFEVIEGILGELPMIYCVINLALDPGSFSLSSVAILHQSAENMKMSVTRVIFGVAGLRAGLATVKRMDTSKVENVMKDGTAQYAPPPPGSLLGKTGMSFELRNVRFTYPGSENVNPALSNISIDIKPGSIVVIVGENGSGKSTLVRILSRFYDPISGDIFIDGRPSREYQMNDLHRSSAILSQDSLIYPLSLKENIGLGHPDFDSDMATIEESAREGGAASFIEKLSKGYDTYLDPYTNQFYHNLHGNNHPLLKMSIDLNKKPDLSGGEKQRVVAARTFMRFKSGKINFVAVDEPSSALDAEGEYQLFQQLLAKRQGKTMVFVTHRFGHLTKVADQIICMKEGRIVETGTHPQLMEANGEYAKLYNIQAQAFL